MLEEGKDVIIDDEAILIKASENDLTAITILEQIIVKSTAEPVI